MQRILSYVLLIMFLFYSFFRFPQYWFQLLCLAIDSGDGLAKLINSADRLIELAERDPTPQKSRRTMHSPPLENKGEE